MPKELQPRFPLSSTCVSTHVHIHMYTHTHIEKLALKHTSTYPTPGRQKNKDSEFQVILCSRGRSHPRIPQKQARDIAQVELLPGMWGLVLCSVLGTTNRQGSLGDILEMTASQSLYHSESLCFLSCRMWLALNCNWQSLATARQRIPWPPGHDTA